jgi:predicted DNA-binding transcriptional regulator AlpA
MDSQPRRILTIKDVLDRVPYSRVTVWRKSKDADDPFPAQVDVGPNRTGIYEDELAAWQAGLARRGASCDMPEDGAPADEANAA